MCEKEKWFGCLFYEGGKATQKGMETFPFSSANSESEVRSSDGSIGSNYFYKQQCEHTSFACIILPYSLH